MFDKNKTKRSTLKLPDVYCGKRASAVYIDELTFSPEVEKKLNEAKEMMETFADFDIHDSVYVNFMTEVLKPSFSVRAIKGTPHISVRSDNLARDLILFDPMLLEEYMNRGKRKTSVEESDE